MIEIGQCQFNLEYFTLLCALKQNIFENEAKVAGRSQKHVRHKGGQLLESHSDYMINGRSGSSISSNFWQKMLSIINQESLIPGFLNIR